MNIISKCMPTAATSFTDQAHGVVFNVDDSGYLKQTAWLKSTDGFLVLDRNLNGQIDSGTRTTVIPEGILIQASGDGHISLLVTRIDDRTALEPNRDGSGYLDGSKSECYDFSSCSRPYLLGCSTKALSKITSNDHFWRLTA